MEYKTTIGLEIHVELNTASKMFCSCKNDFLESRANYNICPVCTAQPGSLPVANKAAIAKVIKTGWALNCQIAKDSKFDRKNYFYPDLPKGYQISQFDKPLCSNGYLEINGKKIRISRIHLEEDTGKLIHSGNDSLVDFNRAGVPLMEMVTEPDLTSAREARDFAEELRTIFRYLDISNADMEKGQMRIEVNISLSENNKLGTKVEIKNLNSFRIVEKSINYEIKRQSEVLSGGGKVIQETRGWDEKKNETVSQREKEEAHDYRYFPEPDLVGLHFDSRYIEGIRKEIPELPNEKRERFKSEYDLNLESINIFILNRDYANYYEKVMSELRNWVKDIEIKKEVSEKEFFRLSKMASNYLTTDLIGMLKGASISDSKIRPENYAEFIALIYEGKISSKIAKIVLAEMNKTGIDPTHIIDQKDLSQIDDDSEIEQIIKTVITNNPKPVKDYRGGKENVLQFLIGQIMKESKGRANPDKVQELLKKLI